ncbi:hypothetical protein N7449_007892 [Penicillium cf. viridicatum]|uniref:Uncharacterized protein n=1 Tax=Penicillium cf. viridicatum TaxID=2972119 RepID=A0A9W9JI43_9EURO|nr:hypothetical protein N7449_007892 [Penicillium cf. viridicatum]
MPSIFGKKTKTPAPSMFDGGNFKPAKGYSSNNYRIECQNVEYDRCTFVDVMVTEMTLRGLIQHYDRVEKKLEKPVYIPGDKSNVQQWEEELQHLQKEILLKQHELYKNEAFLPHQPLKQMIQRGIVAPSWSKTVPEEGVAAVEAVGAASAAI